VKLGKLAPKLHSNTLLLAKYLTGELPSPATKVYREYKTPAAAMQMYGNDTVGDCTCAGAANLLILWTAHTGSVVIPTLNEVMAMYSAVSGYVPGNETTDNGAAMTDVLAYLQSTGLSGHKILGWAQIDHTNLVHRQLAVDLFGATYVGVQLPSSAQDQFSDNEPWEVVSGDSIEGGHAIIHPGYGSQGGDYVSWARWDQKASSAWESAYIDEEYVVITQDWIDQATQKTPGGIDLSTLQSDLALLKQ
jgi:hypothetical protein